ncbi:hypothetical protein JAAARDRAFT_194102 [Jaapia argillacea MUCL 33604]|uniref:Uncharacterized protein n=1 Tax=Jaapia argillacea MUCL 33604 TaxID=933084 RepID=A0A067PVF4_9AGAM|nr:hypothetical protein JAAARDRAFT_194102 [Jaapia argillacea MUCL 33604]
MTWTVAPPLFLGLSARILLELLFSPAVESIPALGDYLFNGVWQGVGFYFILTEFAQLAAPVALAIVGKLFWDLREGDVSRVVLTFLGVGLGVLGTDVLAQVVEDGGKGSGRKMRIVPMGDVGASSSKREKESRSHRDREREREKQKRERKISITAPPSISLESSLSTLDPHGVMTPLEREVAELRARASLADSERRRFKEERKWAISMGNKARAEQMGWQVRRYAALQESFNKEADKKLIEAASRRPRKVSRSSAPPEARRASGTEGPSTRPNAVPGPSRENGFAGPSRAYAVPGSSRENGVPGTSRTYAVPGPSRSKGVNDPSSNHASGVPPYRVPSPDRDVTVTIGTATRPRRTSGPSRPGVRVEVRKSGQR